MQVQQNKQDLLKEILGDIQEGLSILKGDQDQDKLNTDSERQ